MDGIQPIYRITANGRNITDDIAQRFIDLTLTDATGFESDILEIRLSNTDPDNPVVIPPEGAELELALGYDGQLSNMGLFIVDEAELEFWPGALTIRARSAVYQKSKTGKTDLQTQKNRSWEKGTKLGALVDRIAKDHAMESAVAGSLRSIVLPHISQADESDLNLLVRLAKRYDAVVKPGGGKIVLAKRGESKSIGGQNLAPIRIVPGDCSAARMVRSKRETAGMVVAYWHAVKQAKRNEVKVGSGEPVRRLKQYYPTQEMALAAARADLDRRKRGAQTLSMTITGRPDVAAECQLFPSGFHPDVDQEWLITRVVHRMNTSGYACDLEAEEPNASDSDTPAEAQ